MLIREAVEGDANAIASILNARMVLEWTAERRSHDTTLAWMQEHECVLVAELGREVIGVAAYGWYSDAETRPGYRFTVENTVHIRQDHWRANVGRALMEVLIEQARRSGKHAMIAAVDAANNASIQFHQHLGFIEVGRLSEVGERFGRWQDLVLLELKLDLRRFLDAKDHFRESG